ncbi:unnamed protein product, partial [Polarella glacialis]
AWASAKLNLRHDSLCAAASAEAAQRLNASDTDFDSTCSAGISWGFATLGYLDETLLSAIAVGAEGRMRQCRTQELSNLAWCLGTVSARHHGQLLEAVSGAAVSKVAELQTSVIIHGISSHAVRGSLARKIQCLPSMKLLSSDAVTYIFMPKAASDEYRLDVCSKGWEAQFKAEQNPFASVDVYLASQGLQQLQPVLTSIRPVHNDAPIFRAGHRQSNMHDQPSHGNVHRLAIGVPARRKASSFGPEQSASEKGSYGDSCKPYKRPCTRPTNEPLPRHGELDQNFQGGEFEFLDTFRGDPALDVVPEDDPQGLWEVKEVWDDTGLEDVAQCPVTPRDPQRDYSSAPRVQHYAEGTGAFQWETDVAEGEWEQEETAAAPRVQHYAAGTGAFQWEADVAEGEWEQEETGQGDGEYEHEGVEQEQFGDGSTGHQPQGFESDPMASNGSAFDVRSWCAMQEQQQQQLWDGGYQWGSAPPMLSSAGDATLGMKSAQAAGLRTTSPAWASSLSEEQLAATTPPLSHPLLVFAGPGSGKTLFLAARISKALAEGVAPPQSIVAVTYTRKAAAELSLRVKRLAGCGGGKVWVSTLHALALRLLRDAGQVQGGAPWRVVSEQERRQVARCLMDRFGESLGPLLGQGRQDDYLDSGAADHSARGQGVMQDHVASLLQLLRQIAQQPDRWAVVMEQQPVLASVRAAFGEELHRRHLLDVTDVIPTATRLLESSGDHGPGRRWAAEFVKLLFVDEWQDTDLEQRRFLLSLLGNCCSSAITAVGDDDQRIYAWRRESKRLSAGGQALVRLTPAQAFLELWPTAVVRTLGTNHRSLPKLVACAARLISHNKRREPKELKSARADLHQQLVPMVSANNAGTADLTSPSGPGSLAMQPQQQVMEVCALARESLASEARWIGEELLRLRGGAGASGRPARWCSFAVLARTNALAEATSKVLSQAGVPIKQAAVAGDRRSEAGKSAQALDLLSYLRLVVDPHHDSSFLRVMNTPRRGLGKAAVKCLHESFGAPAEPARAGFQPLDGVDLLDVAGFQGVAGEPACGSFNGAMLRLLKAPWKGGAGRAAQGLASFDRALRAARVAATGSARSAGDVLRVLLSETGYATGTCNNGGQKSVQRLLESAEQFCVGSGDGLSNATACVVRFLQETVSGGPGASAGDDCVCISTIHGAKGLEWDTVFVVQCNELTMPLLLRPAAPGCESFDPTHDAEELLEEERRLFYVAMTRARDKLVLTFSLHQASGDTAEPSRFLFEAGILGDKAGDAPPKEPNAADGAVWRVGGDGAVQRGEGRGPSNEARGVCSSSWQTQSGSFPVPLVGSSIVSAKALWSAQMAGASGLTQSVGTCPYSGQAPQPQLTHPLCQPVNQLQFDQLMQPPPQPLTHLPLQPPRQSACQLTLQQPMQVPPQLICNSPATLSRTGGAPEASSSTPMLFSLAAEAQQVCPRTLPVPNLAPGAAHSESFRPDSTDGQQSSSGSAVLVGHHAPCCVEDPAPPSLPQSSCAEALPWVALAKAAEEALCTALFG